MPKVYLSPAYHRFNPCAVNGCDETTHNNEYLDKMEPYLSACGIEYKRGPWRVPMSDEDGTQLMVDAVKESNEYRPDIHYVSHTNAANGKVQGYRPMIYPGYSDAVRLADLIMDYRREIYDQPIQLKYDTGLYELYATNSIAYYEEHVFHDNLADAIWFHENMEKIAQQTVRAFCSYFGIPFVEPERVQESPGEEIKPEEEPGEKSEPTPEETPQNEKDTMIVVPDESSKEKKGLLEILMRIVKKIAKWFFGK